MPVVPRMESPPTMPSRPLSVLSAISSPPGMEISTSTSPGVAEQRGSLRDGGAHHLARHGIDGGLAGRNGQAGPRHGADARPGAKHHARARRAAPDRRYDQRAMRDVGVVARILDDAGASRTPSPSSVFASAKAGCWPPGSVMVDGIGELAR